MRKAALILIFISTQIYSYSQGYDLIITTDGDSIFCRTDSITDTHIYLKMMVKNNWVPTIISRSTISDYFPNQINKDVLFIQQGKIKIFNTWITLNNFPMKIEGVLYELNDSSISISNSVVEEDYAAGNFETINLYISDIETIKTRRKNSILRDIGIGAVSGFTVGGIAGLSAGAGDDFFPPVTDALLLGVPAAIIGAGIGALVGSFKVKIPINGNISNYNKQKNKLRKYSLQ